jgi:hypothetical protein
MLKRAAKQLLERAGIVLFNSRKHHASDGLYTVHHDRFRGDPKFRAAYRRAVQASAGVDPNMEWRLHVALWAATQCLHLDGDFVECGVNAGFVSSAIMQYLDWNRAGRKFYLIDTFNGPVLAQFSPQEIAADRLQIAQDSLAAGAYVTDVDRVKRNFAEWPNAQVIKGVVPDILPQLPFRRVAFLHIDMNCAYPEAAALEFFWERLCAGAVVLLDDYTYLGQQCQADALDAVAAKIGAHILALPTGQGLLVK